MALLNVDLALAQLLQKAEQNAVAQTEQIRLEQALGRVLAEPICATSDLPPWPNSAMDGYAFRASDLQDHHCLPVSQKIFAGYAPSALAVGTCARIFTGAPLPEGADTVEMQENTELTEQGVHFLQAVKTGQFVRKQAQECHQGEQLLAQGTRLSAVDLALAASVGVTQLKVYRRFRVALMSTGDELVEPGQPLAAGQIYNSNRRLLLAWLGQMGCEVNDLGIVPDQPEAITEKLAQVADADLLLSTGGVSVGDADYLGQILRQQGQLEFWKLALKPGKPLTFGHYQGTAFLGLPGNPASSLVTFAILARAYILRCLHVQKVAPLSLKVPIAFAINASERREYMRVRLNDGQAERYETQCSGVLRSAAFADGLLVVPENQAFSQGQLLQFIPFSELFI